MKLNTPLPQTLPKECEKAAKIFGSFVDSNNNGLDGVIPRQVLENAKGFAIYSVVKAGFVLSARAGSGVVIARLHDGTWSAPSAIGTAGMGFGTQAGAELTDVLIVLNSTSAVRSFMSAGSVTLGTNLSVAVGPLGRNGEASGSISTSGKISATYSYSKTRGLFGGVSLEGSVIVERQDANAIAFGGSVTAMQLLSGVVDTPSWASGLVKTLELRTSLPGGRKWVDDTSGSLGGYAFAGIPSPSSETPGSPAGKKRIPSSPFSPWGGHKKTASYFSPSVREDDLTQLPSPRRNSSSMFEQHFETDYKIQDGGMTKDTDHSLIDLEADPELPVISNQTLTTADLNKAERPSSLKYKRTLTNPLASDELGRVIALYDFRAREPGDLSFTKGDIINVIERSDSSSDWWTGRLRGQQGVFPANFVEEA